MVQNNKKRELKLGKMNSEEIAAWFGVAYSTYRASAAKRLEELSFYAEFERVYGGVNITRIYQYTYVKGAAQQLDKVYAILVLLSSNSLTSISGMIRYLATIKPEKYGLMSESTMRYRLTQAGNRMFGKTKDKEARGYLGSREYVWAVRVNELNEYRFMTSEEQDYFIELTKQYVTNPDNMKAAWDFALNKDAYKAGELTKEEYDEANQNIIESFRDFYGDILMPMKSRFNIVLVRATWHDVEMSVAKRLLGIPQSQTEFDRDKLIEML